MRRALVILAAVLLLGGLTYLDRNPDLARQVLAWNPHLPQWVTHPAWPWQNKPDTDKDHSYDVGVWEMASWIVSGAGTTVLNGTYVENGTLNGKPRYTLGAYALQWSGTRWQIWFTGLEAYYGTGADLPANPWTKSTSGTDPPPTVSAEPPDLAEYYHNSISATLCSGSLGPAAQVVLGAGKIAVSGDYYGKTHVEVSLNNGLIWQEASSWYSIWRLCQIQCAHVGGGNYSYELYVDGTLRGTGTQAAVPPSAGVLLGVWTENGYGYCKGVTVTGTDGGSATAPTGLTNWDFGSEGGYYGVTVVDYVEYKVGMPYGTPPDVYPVLRNVQRYRIGGLTMYRKQVTVSAQNTSPAVQVAASVAFDNLDATARPSPLTTPFGQIYLWKLSPDPTWTAPTPDPAAGTWAYWLRNGSTQGAAKQVAIPQPAEMPYTLVGMYEPPTPAGGTRMIRDKNGIVWRFDSNGSTITGQYLVNAPKTWSAPVVVASGDYAQPGLVDPGDGYLMVSAYCNTDSKKYQWRRGANLSTWTADGEIT